MQLGIFTILTILFTTLKLCGVITWGWFWIFSPLFVGVSLFILLFLVAVIAASRG